MSNKKLKALKQELQEKLEQLLGSPVRYGDNLAADSINIQELKEKLTERLKMIEKGNTEQS